MDESAYFQKLDDRGTEWARECLQAGDELSHVVLQNVDLNRGLTSLAVATTEHREAAMKEAPLSWAASRKRVVDPTPSARLLLDKLRALADQCKERLAVVVEDNLSQPGDPHLENGDLSTGRLVLYQNKFFNILNLDNITDANKLALHLNQSSGHPLNAFVVLLDHVPDKKELTQKDVDEILLSVLGIINFAFDGETYTLWTSS